MKVLVLSHTSDLVGGAERSMLDLFDDWSERYEIEPTFILREPLGALAAELKKRGWPYHALKYTFWSWPNPPTNPADILQHLRENQSAISSIEKLIHTLQPEVVMTNTIICPWAALAARLARVPHVWFVREYGDLDHNRKFDITREQTFEDIGNLSALVVANSETLARHIEKYVPKSKVTTLYTPFRIKKLIERSKIKARDYFANSGLKVVMTSNITRTKGQLAAVEAVGQLNSDGCDVQLCLIGKNVDSRYYQEIEAAIAKHNIKEKVALTGLQSNIPALLAKADVGVVASRKEAFGRTTFEYLALGKAVVGANSGATPEMVKPGTNGYLFEPGDAKGLAAALRHYVDEPNLIQQHGQASRLLAKKMMSGPFSSTALYERVKAVLKAEPPENEAAEINYLDYLEKLENAQIRVERSLKWRLRQLAKDNYYRTRKLKARLTGK